ncbi:MAG TPA: NADP-dependent oxidoreductase [Gammaproteobacteria bacterium]|nr:NADP-dependent oxidoreductase [Gammaproteobacteria bacterium]
MNSRISLLSRVAMAGLLAACLGLAHAAPPKEQRAILQKAGSAALQLQTVPVPAPAANQVLIHVYAAAVNPADWKSGAPSADQIPGGDVAGVVAALGEGVTGFKVGDPVWGIAVRRPGVLNGAYAEYAVAAVANVVRKPANITFAQAAGLGIATVTAVRVVDQTEIAKGQRVLITGVAGGVGSAAAQAAKAKGAYVIGTASAQHNAFLSSIGVDQVIDYTKVEFEKQVGHVDAVIDTVGGDTSVRAMGTLQRGGWFISTGNHDLDAQCAKAGLKCAPYSSAADAARRFYEEVASLVSADKLKVNVDKSFPLADASKAQAYSKAGHAEGKIILLVDPAQAERK